MALTKGWYKLNETGNTDNTFDPLVGTGHGDEAISTLNTYTNTAKNVSSDGIDSVVIDGTTYAFAATASTSAALETALIAALKSAGYREVTGKACSVAGANTAAVATIITTATLTKMVSAAAADVAFSAA